MDNKKIVLIAIAALIVAAVVIVLLSSSTSYERMEITPNGTSIEVPANQTEYYGSVAGVKLWHWNDGVLIAYNNHEGDSNFNLTGLSFNAVDGLVKNGEVQNIDGFKAYVINADELLEIHIFDFIKVNYNGKFYCIPLSNETTQDNIIICCKDKDIAVHMAKSVVYKNVYPKNDALDDVKSSLEDTAGDLQSKAYDYANGTDLNDVKSSVEDAAGDLQSEAEGFLNNTVLNAFLIKYEELI